MDSLQEIERIVRTIHFNKEFLLVLARVFSKD